MAPPKTNEAPPPIIQRIDLSNFKAFQKFSASFGNNAILLGPNNAEKSTLISVLRLAARMMRQASRIKPTVARRAGGIVRRCHTFSAENWEFVDENIRHEFSETETSFAVRLSNGVTLRAIWPGAESNEDASVGFFYLESSTANISNIAAIKRSVGTLGVIPVLSPIEHRENVLEESYFWTQRDTRHATRDTAFSPNAL